MAQFFGKPSWYLDFNKKIAKLSSLYFLFCLLFIIDFILIKFPNYLIHIFGWISIIIVCGPPAVICYILYKYFDKRYIKFNQGKKGEGSVCYELHKLSDDYLVFQDINLAGHGNIDFVVVGPSGIFTVEVKSHKGVIGFNGTELTKNGHTFKERNFLDQAMAETLSVNSFLKNQIRVDFFVEPVIVFSSFLARLKFSFNKQKNVYVINKRILIKLILSQPKLLSTEQINIVKDILYKKINV